MKEIRPHLEGIATLAPERSALNRLAPKEIRPHLEGIATTWFRSETPEKNTEGNQTSFRRDCDTSSLLPTLNTL